MEDYIYRHLKRYGNTIISEDLYNSLGEKNILDDLKSHGYNCEIVVYDNTDRDCVGNTINRDIDIIVQVIKEEE